MNNTKIMETIQEDIIEKCRDGDRDAFRSVVQTFQPMVFRLAFRLLCDEDEAKDVVQETFIRVWMNIGRYDAAQRFTTWIFTIATRLCLDRLKSRHFTEPLSDDDDSLGRFMADDSADRTLENQELASIIRRLADGLSPKQRLVFTLVHLEGLSAADVEQITGLDADKVKSNLYVARKTIREKLKQLGYE